MGGQGHREGLAPDANLFVVRPVGGLALPEMRERGRKVPNRDGGLFSGNQNIAKERIADPLTTLESITITTFKISICLAVRGHAALGAAGELALGAWGVAVEAHVSVLGLLAPGEKLR